MGRFTDPTGLQRKQIGRFDRVVTGLKLGMDATREPLKRRARNLLSGHIPQKVLNILGNPFGLGNGREDAVATFRGGGRRRKVRLNRSRVPVPSLPINQQTGKLKSSLIVETKGPKDLRETILRFIAPYAKYILSINGTKKMKARGFWEAMRRTQLIENKKVAQAGSDAFNREP